VGALLAVRGGVEIGGLPWSADRATLRASSTNDYRRTQIAH